MLSGYYSSASRILQISTGNLDLIFSKQYESESVYNVLFIVLLILTGCHVNEPYKSRCIIVMLFFRHTKSYSLCKQ